MEKSFVFEFRDGDVKVCFWLSEETASLLKAHLGTGCFSRRDIERCFPYKDFLWDLMDPGELLRLL